MGLSEDFAAAAEQVKNLANPASQDELLKLYGLYKQAEVGDCNIAKPGMFDMKGKAKWEAWNAIKGTSTDDAKEQYIAFVKTLVEKHGTK